MFHICVCDMICGGGVFQKFCVSRLNCSLAFVCMCVCVSVMAWGRGVCANVFPIAGRGVCFKCVCVLSMYLLLQSDRGRERRTDRGRERPSEKY